MGDPIRNIEEYRQPNGREPIIHDLDALRPRAQFITLGGRRFDLSRIPSGIALDLVDSWDKLQTDAAELTGETNAQRSMDILERSVGIVVKLLRRPFSVRHMRAWWRSRITRRWLIRHTDIVQLQRFIALAIDLLFKSFNATDEEDTDSPPQ